ncbi:MAG: transcription termination/antitermination protein NusG [Mariniblastus sp.]|nr:transcription termination/antitermination protein NusG [Mariniblastus sp.]
MSDDEVVSDDSVDSPGIQEAGSVVPSADVESVQGLESEVPVEGVSGGEVEEELNEFGFAASDMVGDEEEEMGDEGGGDVSPIEEFVDGVVVEEGEEGEEVEMSWYILKVQVNRENSICDALRRRVKVAGIERFFGEVLVPTEDVREFNKAGKQRIRKRKLYPGYIVVNMAINDDSWFLVRETSGIGDFTGAAGKPAPLTPEEVSRIIATTMPDVEEDGEDNIKTAIPFKVGDRVRVKEGYFQNHEGEVSAVDERNGRITVMINIFGRPNPVELDHWHVENV